MRVYVVYVEGRLVYPRRRLHTPSSHLHCTRVYRAQVGRTLQNTEFPFEMAAIAAGDGGAGKEELTEADAQAAVGAVS